MSMNRRNFLLKGLVTTSAVAAGTVGIERIARRPEALGPGDLVAAGPAQKLFPTGCSDVDRALHGGMRTRTLMVVVGPPGSGKSDFLRRMAEMNGVSQVHAMNAGNSDMFSLTQRPDGKHLGCLLLNGPEPTTDKEHADMTRDPGARTAFFSRWFKRARDVVLESGGIMVISVREKTRRDAEWMAIPDYVVSADEAVYSVIKSA